MIQLPEKHCFSDKELLSSKAADEWDWKGQCTVIVMIVFASNFVPVTAYLSDLLVSTIPLHTGSLE